MPRRRTGGDQKLMMAFNDGYLNLETPYKIDELFRQMGRKYGHIEQNLWETVFDVYAAFGVCDIHDHNSYRNIIFHKYTVSKDDLIRDEVLQIVNRIPFWFGTKKIYHSSKKLRKISKFRVSKLVGNALIRLEENGFLERVEMDSDIKRWQKAIKQ